MSEVDRHWYVREVKSLTLSLATMHDVEPPQINVISAYGEPLITVAQISCPYLPAGLCSTADNHGIEAVNMVKVWWCKVIATMMYARACRAVGALSMGTQYD